MPLVSSRLSALRPHRCVVLALPLIIATLTAAPGPESTRMLRSPTVSATSIAFAYANNIWVVERAGGLARRLTSFQGQTSHPSFSPDGKWIAFSGEYAGNTDVYVVPAEGGEPRRLTWHPGADTVQGWTPDGSSVLFASSRATWAPSGAPRFWTVPVAGGVEEPMPLPRAYQGKISPDGRRIAYRMNNSWDEERRNYRGGQNRPIWIVNLTSFDLVSPPWTDSKDMDPAWMGDTVYFLSDRDGVSNVWAYDTNTKRLTQLTTFTDFDVKALDAGSGAIVFEQAGYVHQLDPKTGQSQIVSIRAVGDFPWMMPRWEDVTSRMTNIALSPTGKRVVVEARGEVFTVPSEKGDTRNLTHSSGSAERDPAWSPDGKFVSYFSDRSGEYKLYIESQEGLSPPREIALPTPTHYYTPSWSPDSKKLLFTDTHLRVWVVDIASGQAKVVGSDPWMVPQRTLYPSWSPDSKWVAYASRLNSLYRAIFISNTETGEKRQVTDGLADAMFPVWDASGKYLWFLASTDFGLRSQWLDMTSYDREENFGLYLAVLKKDEPSPLLPESDEDKGVSVEPAPGRDEPGRGDREARTPPRGQDPGRAPVAAAEEKPATESGQATRAARVPVTVQVDFEGLQQRIVAVQAVPERQYSQLRAGAAGTVYYLEASPGPPGPGGPRGSTLQRYQLRERKAATFMTNVAEYSVSADGRKLLYRTPGPGGEGGGPQPTGRAPQPPALFLVDADKAPPQAGQGKLDVTLRMYLEPREEFRQIFNEGWRNQRDYLYVPNLHGTDWPKMKEMYGSAAAPRDAPGGSELPARQHGRRDRDRTLLRARRSDARSAALPRVACWAQTSSSTAVATRSRASTTTRAGIPTSAPRCRARRQRHVRRLHRRDQRCRVARARQHLSPARRHGQPADGAYRQQSARDGGRAAGHRRARRQRAGCCGRARGSRRIDGWWTNCPAGSSRTSTCPTRASPATPASTATTSRSRTRRAR